jgi:hypothetical protein
MTLMNTLITQNKKTWWVFPKIAALVSRLLIHKQRKPLIMGTYMIYRNSIMAWGCKYPSLIANMGQTPEWSERGQLQAHTGWPEKYRPQRWSMGACRPCRISFLCTQSRNWKHVVVSEKQKFVGVEKVEDNDEDINQFEEMPLFTNLMNIKHIEKDFNKNLMPYLWKGGNGKFVWKWCITFHINVSIYLYKIECVSYFLATKFVSHMPYIDLVFCSSCHVVDRSYTVARWKWNWK